MVGACPYNSTTSEIINNRLWNDASMNWHNLASSQATKNMLLPPPDSPIDPKFCSAAPVPLQRSLYHVPDPSTNITGIVWTRRTTTNLNAMVRQQNQRKRELNDPKTIRFLLLTLDDHHHLLAQHKLLHVVCKTKQLVLGFPKTFVPFRHLWTGQET